MKMFKNSIKIAIAMLLILSISVTLFALPNFTNAQTIPDYPTYPFVEAIPNPVGVGQTTLINFGLINYLNVDGDGWNVTLVIKAPDGTETTVDRMTWSTGTVGYAFTPEVNGTYILKCTFKETSYNYSRYGVPVYGNYLASETADYELVVQDNPVPYHPGNALPAEYWSRPVDSQLREWWAIAGSWVAAPPNLFAPYNDAPESAHILWTRPIGDTIGGLTGGNTGERGFGTGDAYEGKWSGSVIIAGVLYYNKMGSAFYSSPPVQEVVAVDLHTGETLWTKVLGNNQRISFGQILYWDCLNYRGAFSYLWASSGSGANAVLTAYEAATGNWVLNFTGVPSGTNYWGPNGEFLRYQVTNIGNASNPNWRLLRWNSSYVVAKGRTGMQESWGSAVQGQTFAASRGWDVNVSIQPVTGSVITAFPEDRLIVGNTSTKGVTLQGLNLKKGQEGALLFKNTWDAPSSWASIVAGMQTGWVTHSQENLVSIYWTHESRIQYAFSLETGKYLWETKPQIYADAWTDSPGFEKVVAYDKLYTASLGGIVYCYDIKDGKLLWNYTVDDPYTESYITNNWWLIITFVSDGKLYLGHMEHSALEPKPRGAPFLCLNATDGSLIWRIDGAFRQTRWGGRGIIGDSVIATMDTYDQRVYAIGKGPSAITLSAPDIAVPEGTPVMVKGTLTDVSPGTRDESLAMRFPDGVPVVSDESMSDWMLYVYKQFSRPTDATGVPVSIDANDPNGNYVHLGDTVSDASGKFFLTFTPEMAGDYTIFATFMGSASFYPAFTETAMTVMDAQPTPTTTQVVTNPPYELYTIGTGIAIIVAIALAVILLRRKP